MGGCSGQIGGGQNDCIWSNWRASRCGRSGQWIRERGGGVRRSRVLGPSVVKLQSNGGQSVVKMWSNSGQTAVKLRSKRRLGSQPRGRDRRHRATRPAPAFFFSGRAAAGVEGRVGPHLTAEWSNGGSGQMVGQTVLLVKRGCSAAGAEGRRRIAARRSARPRPRAVRPQRIETCRRPPALP